MAANERPPAAPAPLWTQADTDARDLGLFRRIFGNDPQEAKVAAEAMRDALEDLEKIDGGLHVTTDALAAALKAALTVYAKKTR